MSRESSHPTGIARAAFAALGVTFARLRAQPLRAGLVVAGVGCAFAMLAAVLGGGLVARQQALQKALAAVPQSSRRFRIDRFGLTLDDASYRRANALAQRAFRTLSGGSAQRVVVLRELRLAGELVDIASTDDLPAAFDVKSGRLPHRCDPSVCEVVEVGDSGRSHLFEGDVRLERVGTGELRDPGLLGTIASRNGAGPAPIVLLAPSIAALQHLPSLTSFFRVYSWLSPLQATAVQTWTVPRILGNESKAQSALYDADSSFLLTGPDAVLNESASRGRVAARRLLLVGGEMSALLLGFAVIAAVGLRRGLGAEQRRMLARGARRWQIGTARAAEIGAMTLAGAIGGLVIGAAVVAGIAHASSQPAGQILHHALLTGSTPGVLGAAWLATTAILFLSSFTPREDDVGGRRIRPLDVAAAGAVAAAAVGISRGALDPSGVSSGGSVLLLVLPALVCFVVAVLLARGLAPAMRGAERLTRDRGLTLGLAVLALARAPARTVASCAFVAVALGLALFAGSYRATLDRGATDEAAFQAPLDFTLTEGSALVQPLDAASLEQYRRLPGVRGAYPALRTDATTPGAGSAVLSTTVLGLPARAVAHLRWRSDYSSLSTGSIARKLAAAGEPTLRGVSLPTTGGRLVLHARLRGTDVDAGAVLADSRGRIRVIKLGGIGRGSQTLHATLPVARGDKLVGLELSLTALDQFFLSHDETENGHVAAAPTGVLTLGPLLLAGRSRTHELVTDWSSWSFPTGSAARPPGGTRIRFSFANTGARLIFRPKQATDGRLMPAVVSPDVAAAAGGVGNEVTLNFGETSINARIAGVAERMPTIPSTIGPFVLADFGWLSTALNADAPGEGVPGEVWLSASNERRLANALARPPFDRLDVSSRAAIRRSLAGDPLARATVRALAAAAVVALVLAVLGFLVGLLSELRDERSDLFDLEVRGLAPRELRAQLRTRGAIVIAFGVVGGLCLGLLLSRVVVALVRVSGSTAVPEPPLRLDLDWALALLGLVAVVCAALVVAELTSRHAFRRQRPENASWSLE